MHYYLLHCFPLLLDHEFWLLDCFLSFVVCGKTLCLTIYKHVLDLTDLKKCSTWKLLINYRFAHLLSEKELRMARDDGENDTENTKQNVNRENHQIFLLLSFLMVRPLHAVWVSAIDGLVIFPLTPSYLAANAKSLNAVFVLCVTQGGDITCNTTHLGHIAHSALSLH